MLFETFEIFSTNNYEMLLEHKRVNKILIRGFCEVIVKKEEKIIQFVT